MNILSNWKLTFGATVILDYGDLLAGELPFDQGNGTEEVPTPDSARPLLLDTGNSAVRWMFSRFIEYDSDHEAAAGLLDGLIYTAASGVATLKIQRAGWTDGRYWIFAQCRISNSRPIMMTDPDKARIRRDYSLTCSGLSYVAP